MNSDGAIEACSLAGIRCIGIRGFFLLTDSIDKPRYSRRDFVENKILVRIIEVNRTKEQAHWQWQIKVRSVHTLEGFHYSPLSMSADIVLMAVARNASDPAHKFGLNMWDDAWERRLLWNEVQAIRREVMKAIEGDTRTLN